jgi:hypothetical protein
LFEMNLVTGSYAFVPLSAPPSTDDVNPSTFTWARIASGPSNDFLTVDQYTAELQSIKNRSETYLVAADYIGDTLKHLRVRLSENTVVTEQSTGTSSSQNSSFSLGFPYTRYRQEFGEIEDATYTSTTTFGVELIDELGTSVYSSTSQRVINWTSVKNGKMVLHYNNYSGPLTGNGGTWVYNYSGAQTAYRSTDLFFGIRGDLRVGCYDLELHQKAYDASSITASMDAVYTTEIRYDTPFSDDPPSAFDRTYFTSESYTSYTSPARATYVRAWLSGPTSLEYTGSAYQEVKRSVRLIEGQVATVTDTPLTPSIPIAPSRSYTSTNAKFSDGDQQQDGYYAYGWFLVCAFLYYRISLVLNNTQYFPAPYTENNPQVVFGLGLILGGRKDLCVGYTSSFDGSLLYRGMLKFAPPNDYNTDDYPSRNYYVQWLTPETEIRDLYSGTTYNLATAVPEWVTGPLRMGANMLFLGSVLSKKGKSTKPLTKYTTSEEPPP